MRRLVLAVLAVLPAAGLGQHWEFEQVDTAPWGVNVQMRRHPDGRLFLCYQYPESIARVAWKDTAWHYDLPGGNPGWRGPTFDIAPDGRLGVAWYDPYEHIILAERVGDTWQCDTTGLTIQRFGGPVLGYDPASRPWVTHSADDWFLVATRDDSTWRTDSIQYYNGWHTNFSASCVLFDPQGRAHILYYLSDDFPDRDSGHPWWLVDLSLASESGDSWVVESKASGFYTSVFAEALALDSAGQPRVCRYQESDSAFRYEGLFVDVIAFSAAMFLDLLERPCICYTRPELVFVYWTQTGWVRDTVTVSTGQSSSVAMMMGDDGQPVVAFSNSTGLWLARGVDVLGVEEQTRPEDEGGGMRAEPGQPTVLRGPELLRLDCRVVDIQGRDVTDRRGRLAPGVYFIGEGSRGRGFEDSRVRKVIVQR